MLDGEVRITLAGQEVTLLPTLGAAVRLNHLHGDFGSLLGKLESYDLAAASDTVHWALGRSEADRQRTTEEVFAAGLIELAPSLIHYVILLANGGKPLQSREEGRENGPFDVSRSENTSSISSSMEPDGWGGLRRWFSQRRSPS